MRALWLAVLLQQLLYCFWWIRQVKGLIHHLELHEDPRSLFLIEGFGFGEGGTWEITVKEMTLYAKPPRKVGFVMLQSESESDLQQELEHVIESQSCLLDNFNDAAHNGMMLDVSDPATWAKSTLTHTVSADEKGLYNLLFVRCEPTTAIVSFKLRAAFINPGPNYLSAGDRQLPAVYFSFFAVFMVLLVMWIVLLHKRFQHVHHIHHMMTVLLLFKTLSMLFEGIRYHYLKLSGTAEAWSIVYFAFSFLKGITLFVVILLIGTGWSLIKPYLNGREKNIVLVVLCLQVLDNIAIVYVEETAPGSRSWLTWKDILSLVDVLCCFAILFPIVWSIRHLRQAAQADGKTAYTIRKLNMFRQFYLMVFSYIYVTRIVIYLLGATLSFELAWVEDACTELATLVFYVTTGYKFRPDDDNPYLKVDTGEDTEMITLDDEDDFDGALRGDERTSNHHTRSSGGGGGGGGGRGERNDDRDYIRERGDRDTRVPM